MKKKVLMHPLFFEFIKDKAGIQIILDEYNEDYVESIAESAIEAFDLTDDLTDDFISEFYFSKLAKDSAGNVYFIETLDRNTNNNDNLGDFIMGCLPSDELSQLTEMADFKDKFKNNKVNISLSIKDMLGNEFVSAYVNTASTDKTKRTITLRFEVEFLADEHLATCSSIYDLNPFALSNSAPLFSESHELLFQEAPIDRHLYHYIDYIDSSDIDISKDSLRAKSEYEKIMISKISDAMEDDELSTSFSLGI